MQPQPLKVRTEPRRMLHKKEAYLPDGLVKKGIFPIGPFCTEGRRYEI
jgi:hypothetical protein